MNEKQKKIEEKVKRCPFDKTLKCVDCRLYQTYIGGRGARLCVFLNMKEV